MPQIIYTDTMMDDNGLPLNTTPAATYSAMDIATILDCVSRGELVCGGGEDYPIEWEDDASCELPWGQNGPKTTTPWRQY